MGYSIIIAQYVPCLGNKRMEFSYETLENEPRSPALGCFNIEQGLLCVIMRELTGFLRAR
jgi:hypothetical protein